MIFILEGPDGAGKSTLARALCTEYQLDYMHEGPPPPNTDMLVHYGLKLQQARYHPRGVVFDRLALGERVYGPILRGEDQLGDDGWLAISRLISAAGAIQVLCLPSYRTCYENWTQRLGHELVRADRDFRAIYDAWDEIASRVPQDVIHDYTEGAWKFDMVVTHRLPFDMIGSPRATYLLVGDRGSNTDSALDLPFFGGDNCVSYLNHALTAATFKEEEIAFINAYPLRGSQTRVIPPFPKTIALGNVAARVCATQAVSHTKVLHPQFVRRFKHHELLNYALQLKACR